MTALRGFIALATLLASLVPDSEKLVGLPIGWQFLFIILGTLISEDAVCVAVGVLIGNHQIEWWVGVVACFVGIYIGDLGFFLLGRLSGKGLMKIRFFTRGFGPERLQRFGAWFDRRPWAAIAMCRVLPGLRVPLYLAVGALTKRTRAFFWWTCFYAFVWTPALIFLVALMGNAVTEPLQKLTGHVGWSMLVELVLAYLIIRFIMLMSTHSGRKKLAGRFGFLWGRRHVADDDDPCPPDVREAGGISPVTGEPCK
jgi:membrane protein DedA with SNARE-associated domain